MNSVKQPAAILLLTLLMLGTLTPAPIEETALRAPAGLWISSDSEMNDLDGSEGAVAASDPLSCFLHERLHSQTAPSWILSSSAAPDLPL